MGGSFDALTSRGQQQAPGRYSGTAVPHVAGPGPATYTQPQNWASPAVSGRDLIVHRDVLRQVAGDLAQMAGLLQATLSACAQAAAPVAGAPGSWPQAQQLARAMTRAHTGVTQFTGQLTQAHHDMAARLTMSADRYDAAEHQITSLIHAATDPSATIVGSGGQDTPVQPGYGQNWTPQQRAAYYRIQRLENMPGNGGPSWTATYPITEDAAYAQGSSSGYTWQQVNSLLAATDPGAISAAGAAYGKLSSTLTQIAGQLASHGQTLAANWGGSTAVTAVSQVQQLHQTASDMQANTWAAEQALQWYGPVLAAFRASLPKPASTHPADVTAANQAAQQRMAALNSHIETAYYQMPGAVNKNLPPALAGAGGGPGGSGGTAAPGGGGGYPGGAGVGYPGGGYPGGGYPGGGGHPGGSTAGGGHPGTAGGYPGGAGTGQPGGAAGTFPAGPGGQPPAGPTRLAGLAPGGPGSTAPGFPAPARAAAAPPEPGWAVPGWAVPARAVPARAGSARCRRCPVAPARWRRAAARRNASRTGPGRGRGRRRARGSRTRRRDAAGRVPESGARRASGRRGRRRRADRSIVARDHRGRRDRRRRPRYGRGRGRPAMRAGFPGRSP